jgi:hypothetical protein
VPASRDSQVDDLSEDSMVRIRCEEMMPEMEMIRVFAVEVNTRLLLGLWRAS